jgi:antirestriction protein ArdC
MSKKSVNEIIIARIVDRIQSTGELPWSKPWKAFTYKGQRGSAFNVRGSAYRGFNSVLLSWLPYEYPIYGSFKQIQDLGGKIRKGEKSHVAMFFKMLEKDDRKGENSESTVKIPLIRYYNVFNISQCENLEGKIPLLETAGGSGLSDAQKIVEGYQGPKIIEKAGGRACYYPSLDTVEMPSKSQFSSESDYFSTLFHELSHSTGSIGRLNRETLTGGHRFGSKEYGREELIAELGACFLCGLAGIEKTTDNSAAYIQSWLKTIQEDSSILGFAAAKAQKAFDLVVNTAANEDCLPVEEAMAA